MLDEMHCKCFFFFYLNKVSWSFRELPCSHRSMCAVFTGGSPGAVPGGTIDTSCSIIVEMCFSHFAPPWRKISHYPFHSWMGVFFFSLYAYVCDGVIACVRAREVGLFMIVLLKLTYCLCFSICSQDWLDLSARFLKRVHCHQLVL